MKIAIVTLTTTSRRTGVAEYLINLIGQLQGIDTVNEYFVFTARDNRHMFSMEAANFTEIALPISHAPAFVMRPLFHLWQNFFLPVWCWRKGVDVVHLPNTLYVTGWMPTIVTIHDIVELKMSKYSKLRTLFRKWMINSAIRNARTIIAVSENSARDIRDLGAQQVVAVPNGFSSEGLRLVKGINLNILSTHKLIKSRYLLFIGTLMKHKNIPILVNAFSDVMARFPDLKLVLVGAPDNDYDEVKSAVSEAGESKRILILNYVSHEDKLVLLGHASIFCFISSYEGFGFPILEAQAMGVPVIGNAVSSLPEVGGDGLYLVDPFSLRNSTARAIVDILEDQDLRDKLCRAGKENIKRYSWEKCASSTLNEYLKFARES